MAPASGRIFRMPGTYHVLRRTLQHLLHHSALSVDGLPAALASYCLPSCRISGMVYPGGLLRRSFRKSSCGVLAITCSIIRSASYMSVKLHLSAIIIALVTNRSMFSFGCCAWHITFRRFMRKFMFFFSCDSKHCQIVSG